MKKMYIKPEVKRVLTMTSCSLLQPSRGVQMTKYSNTSNFTDMEYGGETSDSKDLWGSRENDYYDDEEE